jgi:hypothetical protein
MEEMTSGTDIKTRIKSLSLQPWGYGHSYLKSIKEKVDYSSSIHTEDLMPCARKLVNKKIKPGKNNNSAQKRRYHTT